MRTLDTLTAAHLDRLGVAPEPPSVAALTRLHRAHVERVPYETFWIHLGEPWGIDPVESARRIATTRRGGYCYHLNGALARLLRTLGYRVTTVVAGVHEAGGPNADTLRNHAALVVDGLPTAENPEGRWWVDAGLGDALHEPVPLVDGHVARQGLLTFRVSRVPSDGVGDWHLQHDPTGSFTGVSLVDAPAAPGAFTARHAYNATSPESGFARTVTAQRRTPGGTSVLRGCVLTLRTGDRTDSVTCRTREEWLTALDDELGLSLTGVDPARVEALWASVGRAHEAWLATTTVRVGA